MERIKSLLSQLKQLVLNGYNMFQENRMSIYSGYATLFIVTAIFPCIVLIISIVNLLPGYSTKDVADVLLQILPDLGPIKELVISIMGNLKDQSGGLLASAAAITTLWSASKGVSAIQKGLNELDEPEQRLDTPEDTPAQRLDAPESLPKEDFSEESLPEEAPEPKEDLKHSLLEKVIDLAKAILKRLVFTVTLIVLIPALLLIEMLGDSVAGVICAAIKKINPDVLNSTLSMVDSFFHVTSLVVIFFALLVILQIYAVLPAKRRTLKSQLPGAILTGVCWLGFTELFSFFIPRFYHASSLYGSLASLFLLLLWLRFIVMILFAGGVLNRTLEEGKRAPEQQPALAADDGAPDDAAPSAAQHPEQ